MTEPGHPEPGMRRDPDADAHVELPLEVWAAVEAYNETNWDLDADALVFPGRGKTMGFR